VRQLEPSYGLRGAFSLNITESLQTIACLFTETR
jgi:hypothetical protein